jgi:hypothetical protein
VKSTTARALFGVIAALTLTSCLSTDVSLDLRDPDTTRMEIVYTIPQAIWELGVFDHASPERAIPVSERDARETAGLYDDVSLEGYRLDEEDDHVVITVTYLIGSPESLAAIWGSSERGSLLLDGEAGTLSVPLAGGVEAVDAQQRELIIEAFRDRHFSLTVTAPGAVEIQSPGDVDAAVSRPRGATTVRWEASMGDLLLSRDDLTLIARWEVDR